MDLLLNPKTTLQIDAFVKNPATAVIIDTNHDETTGKHIAQAIYTRIVSDGADPIIELSGEKTIGIEHIRELKSILSLRAHKSTQISRFIQINKADTMTIEAQNSLLKLLEELPDNTVVSLICERPKQLADTIYSRCFRIEVLPLSREMALDYGKKYSLDAKTIEKNLLLSDGKTSVFQELSAGTDTEYQKTIDEAKHFLASSVYERQKTLKKITDKTYDLEQFMTTLKLVTKSGMRSAPTTDKKNQWKKRLSSVIATEKMLHQNGNKKLALLHLSLEI